MIRIVGEFSQTTTDPLPSTDLVRCAFERAFSSAQIAQPGDRNASETVRVFTEPALRDSEVLQALRDFHGRIVLFGSLGPKVMTALHMTAVEADFAVLSTCGPAPLNGFSESSGIVEYLPHVFTNHLALRRRPLVRYDFANEWNNLGYGAVTESAGFGIAQGLRSLSENEIATVSGITFAAAWDLDRCSVLWFNRAVGPIDSFEWSIVERFIEHERTGLPDPLPRLSEIPWQCTSAVTMRLDCDESILSATPLYDLYTQEQVPFSLAVKTCLLSADTRSSDPQVEFLRQVAGHGGTILSHSHQHFENWGPNYDVALTEARTSKAWLEARLDRPVHWAVSPFHKNKAYSLRALKSAGYLGTVSGIIANDPEYLMARAGFAPQTELFSHSQQCMLHGDCLLKEQDPLRIYKQAFQLAQQTQTFFGFLDHPFSERYQYGWKSESERLQQHTAWLHFLKAQGASFYSQDQALGFLHHKAQSQIWLEGGQPHFRTSDVSPSVPSLQVQWKGRGYEAREFL
jgi:hypothetical protein